MKARVDMDTRKVANRIGRRIADTVQAPLDTQVLKDSNYYIPKDTGALEQSGVRHSQIGRGVIIWKMPYVRKQYFDLPHKSTETNPNARMRWFEVAKAQFKRAWINLANRRYAK